jgi:site-specific recombinase XerD
MYSIIPILHHHADKDGLKKIVFQVIYNRVKIYHPTSFKVANFDGKVTGHPLANKINQQLNIKRVELESKLITLAGSGRTVNAAELKEIVSGVKKESNLFSDFVEQLIDELKGKLVEGRLRHYTVVKNKIEAMRPNTNLSDINTEMLQRLERSLRNDKLDTNTINSIMRTLKAILSRAAEKNKFDPKQIERYKPPKYIQKIPDYLTEDEMVAFEEIVKATRQPAHKLAGYYFLLGCYTGYRISDLKAFDYSKRVKVDKITLRAKKNGSIVSILIYPMLQRILDFVKDHPLTLSEPKVREYVKDLANLSGLGRKIKLHTARHSFAMMLVNRGFTIDEVAELLGDSKDVAKVYARITNTVIDNKVRALLH